MENNVKNREVKFWGTKREGAFISGVGLGRPHAVSVSWARGRQDVTGGSRHQWARPQGPWREAAETGRNACMVTTVPDLEKGQSLHEGMPSNAQHSSYLASFSQHFLSHRSTQFLFPVLPAALFLVFSQRIALVLVSSCCFPFFSWPSFVIPRMAFQAIPLPQVPCPSSTLPQKLLSCFLFLQETPTQTITALGGSLDKRWKGCWSGKFLRKKVTCIEEDYSGSKVKAGLKRQNVKKEGDFSETVQQSCEGVEA